MASKKSISLEKFTPVLVLVSIVLAFAVGVLWQKVESLEGGGRGNTTTGSAAGNAGDTAQAPQAAPGVGRISDEQAKKLAKVNSDDHIRGNKDAPISLVEYSDYECPFCSRFHPTTQQVLDEYGDKVNIVYRHFPLDQLHPKARPAAEASECVAELGGNDAFWKFTDAVFADQTRLSDLESLAVEAGVNASAFNNCVDSGKYEDLVEEQYQAGTEAGVTGTPGNFIVNEDGATWFVPGAYPYEQIKGYIEEALQG